MERASSLEPFMGYPRFEVMLTDPHAERTGSLYAQAIDPVICNYRFELRKVGKCGDTPHSIQGFAAATIEC